MRGKLGFLIGFGAGYVLGAKAGTGRYEQLQRLYGNLLESRGIKQATGKAKEVASEGIGTAKDKVTSAVKDRRTDGSDKAGGLSVAPPPN
jgi:uncharacterized protein YjbJ (UPF0337 family)